MMDSSKLPPISAPDWRQSEFNKRKYRRRATIVLSTVWLMVATPVFVFVQQTASIRDAVIGASGMIISFIVLIGWVAFSSRFEKPLIRYPLKTMGFVEQNKLYRHLGGTETPDGRVVGSEAYHTCTDCGDDFVDGLRFETKSHFVLFGVPLVCRGQVVSYYCPDCQSELWGDTEVSIATLDLVNPEQTTMSIQIPSSDESSEKV